MGDLVQARGRPGDLRRTVGLLVGGGADLLREFVNLGDHGGDFAQRQVQVVAEGDAFVHDAGALLHVVHRFARFLLNAGDEFGDFLGGLRRFFRQLAHFIGDDGESQPVFAGARRFDRRVQRQQVGLLGQIVNHLHDLADIVGALSEHADDFAGR